MERGVWGALVALMSAVAFSSHSVAADPPQFQVDPFWPKPLPNNWLLGQVASVAVGPDDHVWILQRPRSLTDDEKGAALTPPRNKCCAPAPSVMEFDADGRDAGAVVALKTPHIAINARGSEWNQLHPALERQAFILEVPGYDGQGPDQRNVEVLKRLASLVPA